MLWKNIQINSVSINEHQNQEHQNILVLIYQPDYVPGLKYQLKNVLGLALEKSHSENLIFQP